MHNFYLISLIIIILIVLLTEKSNIMAYFRLFIFFLLVWGENQLMAQSEINIGPEVGLNYSFFNYTVKGEKASNDEVNFGLKVGVAVEKKFVDMFGLQSGLYFDQSGSKIKVFPFIDPNGSQFSTSAVYDFNKITLPLNAQLYLGNPRKIRFMAGAGPFLTYLVNGKKSFSSESTSFPVEFSTSSKVNFSEEGISHIDYGFGLNLGLITSNGLFLRLSGAAGLAKNSFFYNKDIQWKQIHTGVSLGFLL